MQRKVILSYLLNGYFQAQKLIMLHNKYSTAIIIACFISIGLYAQQPQHDTIFVKNDVNSAVMFNKGDHKYLYIQQIIPIDIPIKELKLELISSKASVIDPKYIERFNQDVCIPLDVLEEKFYTLYIKKGKMIEYQKRIIIK
ncbi:MAG: hypothetical protein N2167_02730 [Flavobacteriales bacterium]|nr:hypothetical protein [Flavobacteriales bacterium]